MQKRNMYILLLALAVVLLSIVLGVIVMQQMDKEPIQYIQFRENIQGMTLQPWHEEATDTWHLFLPAYAGPEDIVVTASAGVAFTLEDLPGILQVRTPFRTRAYSLQIQQSTNLPTLSLDAEEDTQEYINSSLEHARDVVVTITDGEGKQLVQQMAIISGRGNGTWGGEKRPYNLNFYSALSVGPFENISKLCLLAEAYDESKLRNSIAYYGGRELGVPYSSGYMHCNVYINGVYQGLYGITTKQEYEKYIEQDNIQGVFEYTVYSKKNQFFAQPNWDSFRVLYGDIDWIQEVVNNAYDAILSQDWERCEEIIDFASLAKKYALDEFFAIEDLCIASQYYYLDGDNVIHAMLPWDYDWSMGSSNRFLDLPPAQDIIAKKFPDFWVTQLLESSRFREEIVKVLDESFTQEWMDGIDAHMSSQILTISDSLECDALRWDGVESYNRYKGTVDRAHLWDLQQTYSRYYPARRDFLRDYFSDPDAYCVIRMKADRFPDFYLRKGTDAAKVLELSWVWGMQDLWPDPRHWLTKDGLKPEEVGPVYEDTMFILSFMYPDQLDKYYKPVEEPPEEVPPILDQRWVKLLLYGSVVAVTVCMIGTELLRHHIKHKKKDEVAV